MGGESVVSLNKLKRCTSPGSKRMGAFRTFRRQFDIDDYLEDITYELIDIQHMFACLPGEDRR